MPVNCLASDEFQQIAGEAIPMREEEAGYVSNDSIAEQRVQAQTLLGK